MEPRPLPNIFQDDDSDLDDSLSRDAMNAAEFTVDENVQEILNVCGDVTTEEELKELLTMEEDCNGGAAEEILSDDDAKWDSLMNDPLHAEAGLPECHVPAIEAALEVAEEQLEEEVATRKRLRQISPEESGEEEDFDDREFEPTSEELASAANNANANLSAHEANASQRAAKKAAKKTKRASHVVGDVDVGPRDIAIPGSASGLPATSTPITAPSGPLAPNNVHLMMHLLLAEAARGRQS
jgi:hypothetical protein